MKRLALPQVMLCAVTGVAQGETIAALRECLRHIAFGDAALLSHDQPAALQTEEFRWVGIEKISSREEYSHFICSQLSRHCTRSHMLLIQWDGFVIDAARWDDEFLNFDYIGAPWPQFADGNTVGNGGFSLRSKRLLDIVASRFAPSHPEDVFICRHWRERLEAHHGIRFAPHTLAERFSRERHLGGEPTFGFHGLFLFPEVLLPSHSASRLKGMAAALLTGRDGADLLIALMERGRTALAWQLFWRRLRRSKITRANVTLLFRLVASQFRDVSNKMYADHF